MDFSFSNSNIFTVVKEALVSKSTISIDDLFVKLHFRLVLLVRFETEDGMSLERKGTITERPRLCGVVIKYCRGTVRV